ncbi:transposase [Serratia fonticola]|nr:transposase [Serratia fonticola]
MTKPSATKNKPRKQHSPAFRDEALNALAWLQPHANSVCMNHLYTWRSK